MKGMTGLALAIGLGVIGAVCNWIYVANQGAKVATIEFVAVKPSTRIEIGEMFREEHFEPVPIPRNRAGTLERHAVTWGNRQTLFGYRAVRTFDGGELVLEEDTQTLSQRSASERIGKDEVVKSILVDTRTFVTRNVNPGDLVAFTLPSPGAPNGVETVGPFRILALGTRMGDLGVQKASGGSSDAESVLSIAVKIKRPPKDDEKWDGVFEPKAEDLFRLIRQAGGQPAEVSLFSAKLRDE